MSHVKNRVNSGKLLQWTILSQAIQGWIEGATTNRIPLEQGGSEHERPTPYNGDDIVCSIWQHIEVKVKCFYDNIKWGYLRPVSAYNIGKKSEFYSRKYFDEQKTSNSEFIRKYGNPAQ